MKKSYSLMKPAEAIMIIDRLLHGYTVEEMAQETGRDNTTIYAYYRKFKALKEGDTSCKRNLGYECIDAISEKYGLPKMDRADAPAKPEPKPEQKPEPEAQPISRMTAHTIEFIKNAVIHQNEMIEKLLHQVDETNKILIQMLSAWKN